jgi:hypothetical protein
MTIRAKGVQNKLAEKNKDKNKDLRDDQSQSFNDSNHNQDNAMSVDGEMSYCSVEMDETEKAQPLKFKEANSSLHMVEKQEASIHSRLFVTKNSADDQMSGPMAVIKEQEDEVTSNQS